MNEKENKKTKDENLDPASEVIAKAESRADRIREIQKRAKKGDMKNHVWQDFPDFEHNEFCKIFYESGGIANEHEHLIQQTKKSGGR